MSSIDLHIHSRCSDDGELTPEELVALAQEQGMAQIAISDHNSVRGVAAAMAAATAVRVTSAVELDCTYGGRQFHLLGYGFDHTRREFDEIEADVLCQERAAGEEKLRLFQAATGIALDREAILAAAPGGVVTGELVGELLLSAPDAEEYPLLRPYLPGGERADMPNVRFYWDFFSEGKPAYVPIRYQTMEEATSLLHSAGGVAVLAHPGQNLKGDDTLLAGILSLGVDGLEVFSSYHSAEEVARYKALALSRGLLVTCGSDFHGKHKPHIALGGHGADWDDQRLADGLRQRIPGWG